MSPETTARDFTNVPAHAFEFKADVQIGDNGDNAKTAPVKMLARSSKPIEHWYWGRVVHDMAGMVLSKPKLPIDYCHCQDEALGYLNKFDVTPEGLVTSGAITPFSEDDRASEVLYKSKAGVPYEASINFYGDGTVIEEIPRGFSTQVNGTMFEGPGVVVRKWTLRGVAICLYGADQNTVTEFNQKSKPIAVSVLSQSPKESTMSEQDKPGAEAATATVDASKLTQTEPKPAEGTGETPAPVDASKLTGEAPKAVDPAAKKFTGAFGDKGARWFIEGKSFEESAAAFVSELREDHNKALAAKDAEITLLKQKVDAASHLGGGEPVPARVEKDPQKKEPAAVSPALLSAVGSESLAKFAATIKLPGQSRDK